MAAKEWLKGKGEKKANGAIAEAEKAAKRWLGPDYEVITNPAGDKVFMSSDKLRKIRFDMHNPGNDMPHFHL